MDSTKQLFDAIKEKYNLRYDYQVADMIGIHKVMMSKFKKGKEFLTETQQAKIADLLDLDIGYIHIIVEAERTEVPSLRDSLHRLLSQMGQAAAILTLVIIPMMLPVSPALAGSVPSSHSPSYTLCVLRNRFSALLRDILAF